MAKLRPGSTVYQSDFRLSNGKRVRESLKTKNKAEAEHRERELQVVMEAALRGAPLVRQTVLQEAPASPVVSAPQMVKGMTLKEAYKRCMREHEPWRASTSKKTIEDNYKHVSEHFKEERDLATITRDCMIEYVEKLRDEQDLSPSTINQRLSLVSVMMTHAEHWTKGIVQPIKMPRQKNRKGRVRVLSYEEEFKVISHFIKSKRARGHDKDMAELVKFLVDTGFRLGEALRLRTDEIDWDNGMVPAWETKGDEPRQVPMTQRVKDVLMQREHLERPFGMFSRDSADDHWELMRKELKVDLKRDPEFVIHALRHTCASRLVASGMDAFRVQKWMGHKDIRTTQKYVTLFGSDLHDLAKALDSRRTVAAQSMPFGGLHHVSSRPPRIVPNSVSKTVYRHGLRRSVELRASEAQQGFRPKYEPVPPVGEGLLIRRSLVRAQVGEPSPSEAPAEATTITPGDCAQECDQKET